MCISLPADIPASVPALLQQKLSSVYKERSQHKDAAGRDEALDLAVGAQALGYAMQNTTLPTGILDGRGPQMFLAAPQARPVRREVEPG